MFIDVEFWSLTSWPPGRLLWDPTKVSEKQIQAAAMPLYCKPHEVEWAPHKSTLNVSYPVSHHIRSVNALAARKVTGENIEFGIITLNASDFGYSHIWLDLKNSKNVKAPKQPAKPVKLVDGIKPSSACGLEAGCNHHHTSAIEYDYLGIKSLPAKALFLLWENKPLNENQVPDLRVVLDFN